MCGRICWFCGPPPQIKELMRKVVWGQDNDELDYNLNFCCHKSFCTLNIASYGSTIGACQNSSFKHSWIFPLPLNTTLDDKTSVLALHTLPPSLPYILCCRGCCLLYFCTHLNIYSKGQHWSKVNKIIILTEEAGAVTVLGYEHMHNHIEISHLNNIFLTRTSPSYTYTSLLSHEAITYFQTHGRENQ